MALSITAVAWLVGALIPPVPLVSPSVPYPTALVGVQPGRVVTVSLHIDAHGHVTRAALAVAQSVDAFSEAVVVAAAGFRFTPASENGSPVPVVMPFTHTFHARTIHVAVQGEVRGGPDGGPLPGAEVRLVSADGVALATSDVDGRFRVDGLPGEAEIYVQAPGFVPRTFPFVLASTGTSEVFVALARAPPEAAYVTTIRAPRAPLGHEARHFSSAEAAHVPGAFGDPFRVVTALPGVGTTFSLLAVPVIRGTNPAGTGFLLDGVRVPFLFHLLAGPAVVHPRFLDSVGVHPGGFSARYGGYIGGIVDGKLSRSPAERFALEAHADLTHASAYLSVPLGPHNGSFAAAGRYGYPGVLLGLVEGDVKFDYYDYQLRYSMASDGHRAEVMLFGARDALDRRAAGRSPGGAFAGLQFHRAVLRHAWKLPWGIEQVSQLVLGWDSTRLTADAPHAGSFGLEARLGWTWRPLPTLGFAWGAQGAWRTARDEAPLSQGMAGLFEAFPEGGGHTSTGEFGAYLEGTWEPWDDVIATVGVRGDGYAAGELLKGSVDVRGRLWACVFGADPCRVALKASTGTFHQPPRAAVALPGLEFIALDRGLLAAWQSDLGVELRLPGDFLVDVQGYFSRMDPLTYEPSLGPAVVASGEPLDAPSTLTGRAFGVEILLRSLGRGMAFGWLGYAWSRSERNDGSGWQPYAFDRTHQWSLVAGVRLPRNWRFSLRGMYQTGTPVGSLAGEAGRQPGFLRIDLRIDRAFHWPTWRLDVYLDVANVALAREVGGVVGPEGLRYILPSIGLRVVI